MPQLNGRPLSTDYPSTKRTYRVVYSQMETAALKRALQIAGSAT